ncbi:putative transcription factor bZIP family [Helianthus annuus]|uniref:Transcription factor bZIP family n=1 Tax=Helianthus annuus TaxID=4232 RepID=A0A9K3DL80_HELAN|nr:putative transcription factor bZIP family [Helianthus annuus]
MDDGEEVKQSKCLIGNSSNTFRAPSKLDEDSSKTNRRTGDHGWVKPERPLGNRVAVKKYREKKKAQNTYLEEEVKKLRVVNRVLIRKLQLLAGLEAEAVRLRSLLMGLNVQIGDELGVSGVYKQNCNGVSDDCIRRDWPV